MQGGQDEQVGSAQDRERVVHLPQQRDVPGQAQGVDPGPQRRLEHPGADDRQADVQSLSAAALGAVLLAQKGERLDESRLVLLHRHPPHGGKDDVVLVLQLGEGVGGGRLRPETHPLDVEEVAGRELALGEINAQTGQPGAVVAGQARADGDDGVDIAVEGEDAPEIGVLVPVLVVHLVVLVAGGARSATTPGRDERDPGLGVAVVLDGGVGHEVAQDTARLALVVGPVAVPEALRGEGLGVAGEVVDAGPFVDPPGRGTGLADDMDVAGQASEDLLPVLVVAQDGGLDNEVDRVEVRIERLQESQEGGGDPVGDHGGVEQEGAAFTGTVAERRVKGMVPDDRLLPVVEVVVEEGSSQARRGPPVLVGAVAGEGLLGGDPLPVQGSPDG